VSDSPSVESSRLTKKFRFGYVGNRTETKSRAKNCPHLTTLSWDIWERPMSRTISIEQKWHQQSEVVKSAAEKRPPGVVERWLEKLRCPNCAKTGTARVSQADGWTIHVDILPEGFYFIQSESGSNFYCSSCDSSAEL